VNESTAMRPQPPSIQDPRAGDLPLDYMGVEDEGEGAAPDIEDPSEHDDFDPDQPNWMRRAKDAYRFSTSWTDSNYRKKWEDGIRAFNSQHPGDSKYNSEIFKKRSNLYVPKTRAIIRKNEAAVAAALFSNTDRISCTALNPADQQERIGAEVMQELLQYRLTKSIPWFQFVMGGIQDAQTTGAAVAHWHWSYSTRKDAKGKIVKTSDKPVAELIPIENFRFDPSASWIDPVNSSPYLIHIFPMYVTDVKSRMERPDPKGRKWIRVPDRMLIGPPQDDSTRRARQGGMQDAATEDRTVSDYGLVWIHRHIHRFNGTDYEFYTLRSERLLTEPEPLEMTVFHGKRPYVFGSWQIESHKPIPSGTPEISKALQDEINDVKNSRIDNVKFVLNKGYFAKRGKNVDLPALVRNVPGRIVLMDDPEHDVVENSWPDVTQSAYLEEDRNNQSFDELLGNFSASSIQMGRAPREPARSMTLLQGPATILTEYMLKTYVETFIVPGLRQLVLLEQHYETDSNVMEIAKEKSKLFQRYGMNRVTDDMIQREMLVNCNVGMGATDPTTRLQKFLIAIDAFTKTSVKPPPGIDLKEVFKEIMALTGYQDGERFTNQQDPEKVKLMQQIQMLTQKLMVMGMKIHDRSEANQVKERVATQSNIVKLAIAGKQMRQKDVHIYANHLIAKEQAEQAHQLSLQQGQQQQGFSQENAQQQQEFTQQNTEQQAKLAKPEQKAG
jgi:hypothetical protein